MQKAKSFLCVASIIEIVLAAIFLIGDGVYTYSWLSNLNIAKQTINIVLSCVLFVLAVVIAVDGILALRYSRADNETAKKCKTARLLMGIVYLVVALMAFILYCEAEESGKGAIIVFAFIFSCMALVIVGLFNIFTFVNMNKKEEIIVPKTFIENKKPETENKNTSKLDQMIEKLNKISELKSLGLLTDQEFSAMRDKIIKETNLED